MALSSGMGIRRDKGFPLRLKSTELSDLKRRARGVNLSMSEYARCKIFDIPFKMMGGKNLAGRPKKSTESSEATA